MDIVYSIDDNFIPQAAALSVSILKHRVKSGAEDRSGLFDPEGAEKKTSSAEHCVFHILSNGISQENQKAMTSFLRERGGDVLFYDLGDFEGRLEKILGAKPETGRFAKAALGRIFAAEYLPDSVERFLYLDADMIARSDITPLSATDLQGKVAAACAEPTIYENLVVEQAVTQDTCRTGGGPADLPGSDGKTCGEGWQTAVQIRGKAYFNTGLLLVDRAAWDAQGITKKCLTWYAEHNGAFDFADQDILNHVLAGKILPLSQRWNFQTNYHYQGYGSLVKRAPWYGGLITEEDYESSRRDPVIVHYAGDERPWIHGNKNPYREDYRENLKETPWSGTSQVYGRENYMRFYHAVNVMSEKIPGFRTAVSGVYYRTKIKKNQK